MKKALLFGLACGLGLMVNAQSQTLVKSKKLPQINPALDIAKPYVRTKITGYESNDGIKRAKSTKNSNPMHKGIQPVQFGVETQIGETTYDLQSNSSVQGRIVNHGNGTLSAVWTYSLSGDIAAADRGTGYNFFDGTSWGPYPTSRIETEKTGWPSLDVLASNEEVFVSHNIAKGQLTMGISPSVGAGTWATSEVTSTDQVWNRMTTGGTDGNSIHHISLYDPFGGVYPLTGVQSQLLYWRSQDGGATWDIQESVIPGLDQTNFSFFSGDSYHIAKARGDTLALCYFGGLGDVMLAKSIDNGTNWATTKIIDVIPGSTLYDPDASATTGAAIGISDGNNDGVADTLTSSDGAGWVLLDHNGMAHVFFGTMRFLDDAPGDGSWSYFPGTNGLSYWNESFGANPPVEIAGSLDLDTNGVLDIIDIADYFQSLSAFPSAGISDNGCIYVSYSAVVENMDNGTQNFRHIYVIESCDNGCSWSEPLDVTPGSGFEENVYASMADVVDSNIHIVWMQDFEPGIAVNGDNDPFVTNMIKHSAIPVTDFDTIAPAYCYIKLEGDSLFCAGDSVLLQATCGSAYQWSSGETSQSIYYKGAFGDVIVDITTPCGVLADTITLSSLAGIPPVLTLSATKTEVCDGDSAWLTVSSDYPATYLWSTGETSATIGVDSAQTYTVAATNCGGTTVDTISVSLPAIPVASVLGNNAFCSGDTLTLTAETVNNMPSGTFVWYVWSTGDSTQSINVTTEMAITLTVTNCSGSDQITVNTVFQALPTIIMDVNGQTTFCDDGGTTSLQLTAFPNGGSPFTYLWSNSSTAQSITLNNVSETGDYYVTVTDGCGGTVMSDTTAVLVNESPTASTIAVTDASTFGLNDGAIDASVTGGTPPYVYFWNDPNSQSTEDASNLISGTYTLTVTDANNCMGTVSVFVDQPVTIGELKSGELNVLPNPSNGKFIVELSSLNSDEYLFEIRNILGQLVYAETLNGNEVNDLNIDLSENDKGVYLLTISNSEGKRTEKLVIY